MPKKEGNVGNNTNSNQFQTKNIFLLDKALENF